MMRPIYLEFYGVPGCGKSTLSHSLAERLKEKGFIVLEPSYNIDRRYSAFFKKLHKLQILICCSIMHPIITMKISDLVKRNGYRGLSAILQIANVIQKIKVYSEHNNADFIVWDQGLTQASISLSANGKEIALINESYIINLLRFKPHILRIYLQCDISVALSRMNSRSTNDSRVEKMKSESARVQALQEIIKNCNSIKDNYDVIDTTKSSLSDMASILDSSLINYYSSIL